MSTETQEISVTELSQVSQLVDNRPEVLATGSTELQDAALKATKFIFDLSVQSENDAKSHLEGFLSSLTPSHAPQTRSQTRKRKRSPSPPAPKVKFETTPLSSLFVDGMAEDQVWSQLELRAKNICSILDFILETETPDDLEDKGGEEDDEDDSEDEDADEGMDERLAEALERLRNGEDVDFEELGLDESLAELLQHEAGDEDDDEDDEEEFDEGDEDEEDEEEEEDEGIALNDSVSDSDEEEEPATLWDIVSRAQKKSKPKSAAHDELNDGFFDLDAFNAETERSEARKSSSGRLDEDEESSDEEGSVDLFAPVGDVEVFEEDDLENDASNLYYKDFFKAPSKTKKAGPKKPESPKKAGSVRFHDEVRVKKIKAKGKSRPTAQMYMNDDDDDDDDEEFAEFGESDGWEEGDDFGEEMDDADEEGWGGVDDQDDDGDEDISMGEDDETEDNPRDTIERLKDDLFAEDESEVQKDMSTHERRMAALTEQISELEQENVAQKDWMLMGEADSRARPQNSLLEEDLEFERVQKPVPVITEEVVQNLEERIKARIREGRFDDVVRIRPLEDKPFLPSRLFELNDQKSKQSLAQIYEDEYVAAQTGGVPGEDRDGKLQKEHEEIEKLWEGICHKLDALCNAHYTPKQPKATISTVSDVSTASMESALPTTKSVSTMLAPEEVFTPATADLRAKSEMTPAEKQALRRKERKAKKKRRDALETSVDKYAKSKKAGSVKKQKEEALKSVVKSGKGVTVVGKKSKDILGKSKKAKS
ncbi:U3 snoRNP protein [Paramarasmius palmivorus]|uniref:U3 small nucleolar ribonucleoprotein protein MPP10 n=1 Tax=Paramarasmius palmivorus TaxID=297713 RepID=A0AAW0DIH6_9AGAR